MAFQLKGQDIQGIITEFQYKSNSAGQCKIHNIPVSWCVLSTAVVCRPGINSSERAGLVSAGWSDKEDNPWVISSSLHPKKFYKHTNTST